jgi:hypothetical protein
MAKKVDFLCDECGYRLSATDGVACSECGTPRGGRRFSQLSTMRIESLTRGVLLLRYSRTAAIVVLSGFAAVLMGTLVLGACRSISQVALASALEFVGGSVVWIGIVVVFGGMASSLGLAWTGLFRVCRATRGAAGDGDPEVSDAARNAMRSVIAVMAIVVPLYLWNPEGSSRPIAMSVSAAVSIVLALQLLMQARLRALCERRTIGVLRPVWPTPLACLMCALLLIAASSTNGDLVEPSTLSVFWVGNAIELGRFARIAQHIPPRQFIMNLGSGDCHE